MSEHERVEEQQRRASLLQEIHGAIDWALTITNSDKLELFLNPQDAAGFQGHGLNGRPIHQSIGVPIGSALIFDRCSGKYIRKGEQIDGSQ